MAATGLGAFQEIHVCTGICNKTQGIQLNLQALVFAFGDAPDGLELIQNGMTRGWAGLLSHM